MGTSEFAPEMVLNLLSDRDVNAETIDAGELLYYPKRSNGLLVLTSQSGESAETRKLAERLPPGQKLVAITNNMQSTLSQAATLSLPMHAGDEAAISTKTYTNTLAFLYLMTYALDGEACLEQALDRLERLSGKMTPADSRTIEHAASQICDTGNIHFIGRGPAMTAVKQASLTFMEGTRCVTTAFTGGAFRHGPFELVDGNHRVVFFIPGGSTCELLKAMAHEVAELGSHVVVITDQDFALPQANCCVLKVADFGEELFPLSAAITQELLLDAVARARGVTAGIFRHGQKVTMRE